MRDPSNLKPVRPEMCPSNKVMDAPAQYGKLTLRVHFLHRTRNSLPENQGNTLFETDFLQRRATLCCLASRQLRVFYLVRLSSMTRLTQ